MKIKMQNNIKGDKEKKMEEFFRKLHIMFAKAKEEGERK